jgi:hypothetical protein
MNPLTESKGIGYGELIGKIVDELLSGLGEGVTVLLGPVVWDAVDGSEQRRWYFMTVSGDRSNCNIDQLAADTRDRAEWFRSSLRLRFVLHRPLVMVDFDDELEMARFMEATWPSPKTKGVRVAIEAERVASGLLTPD